MVDPRYIIYNNDAISGIRVAAQTAAIARDRIVGNVYSGMTTGELDDIAADIISELGGYPTFWKYHGYPGKICVSVNDEVVHGIGRSSKVIKAGDVVSIDVGVTIGGYIGDNAITIIVDSAICDEDVRLVDSTEKALMAGIKAARAGNFVKDISIAVENVAIDAKLSVVREYVGHGCGIELHEPPEIPNYKTRKKGVMLVPGMVLCIEPMFNLGSHKVFTDSDDWTVRTRDGKKSAHFEHMVLITETDPEILTWRKT